MTRAQLSRLKANRDGAVAPTVALSLFAILACGGVAFDYARLAAMDSELQQAADQAALAAATQLDQKAGAINRAVAAAQDLISNNTLFASTTGGVTIPDIYFYAAKADAEAANGTDCSNTNRIDPVSAGADTSAKFVCVRTGAKSARYALTPVVRAVTSGDLTAMAVAGLGSAICKTPPVMICNPNEGGDPTFTINNYKGKGLRLVSVGNGNGSWTAGNFGYLNTHGGSNGVPGLQEALGWVSPPGDCLSTNGVDTKPGGNVPVTDALNTRFDIYDNCQSGGACPPSINSIKDVVRPANASGNNACRLHNSGWQEVSGDANLYLPDATDALTATPRTPLAMGHPRDMCHAAKATATNYCTGPVGTGAWDRDAYFRTNYGWATQAIWTTNTGLAATATRYQVYSWEIAHRGQTVGGVVVLDPRTAQGNGASALTSYPTPVCSNQQTPSYGTGIVPGGTNVDRRRLSVAVVNCSTGANGSAVNGASTGVTVTKWIEVFLVEPSLNRGAASYHDAAANLDYARSGTNAGDVYVEVIGETTQGGAGATAGQVVRRDLPYLIK